MMNSIYLKARAKINLTLEVLEKRKDCYHDIKSVFQKIDLYDDLYIKKNDNNMFNLEVNIKELENEDNIIYKAYNLLKCKYSNVSGVDVKLVKRIPMQAGLGGGSSDCASFLIGMNRLFDLKLTDLEFRELGKVLGADVIPCLYDVPLVATGIGDKIELIDSDLKYNIVVVNPGISCNTKEMYDLLDKHNDICFRDNTDKVVMALSSNDLKLLCDNLFNSFEMVLDLDDVKNELLENGALNSLLTGAGSCVFGIFDDKIKADKAYQKLKRKYDVYNCCSYNNKKRG